MLDFDVKIAKGTDIWHFPESARDTPIAHGHRGCSMDEITDVLPSIGFESLSIPS